MPSYDMSGEKKPNLAKKLLPEGWRRFVVLDVKEETSKKGNPMLVGYLKDEEIGQEETIYMITKQGKRWYLKEFLKACGVVVADGDVYNFELADLKDKIIEGNIEHADEDWIDRDGNNRTTKKHKIREFQETTQF